MEFRRLNKFSSIFLLFLFIGCKNPFGQQGSDVSNDFLPGSGNGTVSSALSTITGVGPVIANNVATSTITVTLRNSDNQPIAGITPTFSATDTGSTNNYGACSATDALGTSTCALRSTYAEVKSLTLLSPANLTGSSPVTFIHGPASQVVFSTQPAGNVVYNTNLPAQPVVQIQDAYNNLVTSGVDSTTNISLAISQGSGAITGTTTVAAVSGVATFTALGINTYGAAKKIRATKSDTTGSGGTATISQDSNAFDVFVNVSPALAAISNQTQTELQTLVVNLSPTAEALNCTNTYFSATSSNTSVMPIGNISFLGVWPNCKVKFQAINGSVGTSNIEVFLTDGMNTVSRTLTLTVITTRILDKLSNTPSAAYGLRSLLALYGGPAIRVRRTSDNAEQDIGFNSANQLDTAALLTFVGASAGHITKWYDQTGNGRHLSQSIAGKQPRIVSSGGVLQVCNSVPCIYFEKANANTMAGPSGPGLGHAHRFVNFIGGYKTVPVPYPGFIADGLSQATATIKISGGTTASTLSNHFASTDSVWFKGIMQTLANFNNYNSAPAFSGLQVVSMNNTSGSGGAINTSGITLLGQDPGLATRLLDGYIAEVVISESHFSDPDRTALEADQMAFFGL